MKVTPASEDHFYVAGAQRSFRKAIHNLLVLCQELPALPRTLYLEHGNDGARLTADAVGHRSLGVNLLYNYTCPLVYEPSGFAGSADANVFPLLSTTEATETAGAFQAGPYEVAMAVKNAKLAKRNANGTPQIVQSTDATSSRLEDMAMRKQLQAMQRSSSIPSNLILTQMAHGPESSHSASQPGLATTTPLKCGSALGADWNSRKQRNVAAVKMAELVVQAWGLDKHNKSSMHLLDVDQLRKNKIKRLNPGRTVNCECGSDHEEDAMVCCIEELKALRSRRHSTRYSHSLCDHSTRRD